MKELFEETGNQETEDFPTPHPNPYASTADALPTAGEESLKENNARSENWISRNGRQERAFSSGPRKRIAERLVSTTDPDATPMRLGGEGETKLGYQAHYVVDGGKGRVILNVLVTSSEVSENRPMLDLLWRTAFRWRLWPHHVSGEAKYGTAENVRAIESANIRAYVALHESGGKGKAFFGKGEFVYDPKRDLYLCPAGEELHRAGKSGKGIKYRADTSACWDCPLKERCTPSEGVRNVNRYPNEEYVERVRA
jgi:hypothetical protein